MIVVQRSTSYCQTFEVDVFHSPQLATPTEKVEEKGVIVLHGDDPTPVQGKKQVLHLEQAPKVQYKKGLSAIQTFLY